MGRVRVLPDHLANQIAAGEVVDRPASALKELIENSFDAGATKIRIWLEAGGKKRIRIEDDGCGMDRDDCLMALERHATSKLTRAEDLFSIRTLGFRGEALPSIASVSRFTLESRDESAEAGVKIEMNGSKMLRVTEVPRNRGTSITVDNLFFNIPARKKFLRTTETELSWMVNLVTQYSFAHIDKHFFLEHNGRVLIDVAPVNTLKERVYQHFGKRMLDELVPFEDTRDWLKMRGLTSSPNFFKTNRNFQFLFVNGRLVKDRVLSHALVKAYEGFGEGKVYPVTFLFVDIPSEELDVNVHPAKTEVRFIHADFVHDTVAAIIRASLVDRKLTIPYRFRDAYHQHPSNQAPQRRDPWQKERQESLPGNDPVQNSPLFSGQSQSADTGEGRPAAFTGSQTKVSERPLPPNPHDPNQPSLYERFLADQQAQSPTNPADGPAAPPQPPQPPQPPVTVQDTKPNLFGTDPALVLPKIIGQFRDSFILAEQEGDLLLIDQHVAHERILYDQITEALEAGEIERQALLVPVTLELTPQQSIEMERLLPTIQKFGFDLDPFDNNTWVIREIPTFAKGEDLEAVVTEIVERAQGKREETALEAIVDHFAATKACKAAIKINMRLTPEKMDHLLRRLWDSSSPLFCPHGRPIILRFRNEEIEKNFLRR